MTRKQVAVYPEPSSNYNPIARINYGAVIPGTPTEIKKGCKQGWVKVENSGYICSRGLKIVSSPPSPAEDDISGVTDEYPRYIIGKGGATAYPDKYSFSHRINSYFLYKNSILSVKKVLERGNKKYLITRDGHYVYGDNAKEMTPVNKIGVELKDNKNAFSGFIINSGSKVYSLPDITASIVKTFNKFDFITGDFSNSKKGWIKLSENEYILDRDVAKLRVHVPTEKINSDEKWIAVDLKEQLLTVYIGNRPVYIVPCSTGIEDNTETGSFKIEWKRRLQTLNLYGGYLRVEDVPFVMYYITERGFAIHTAWHTDFGHKKSHGCVNIPRDDAKWIYSWSAPYSQPFESENLSTKQNDSTKVIVFE